MNNCVRRNVNYEILCTREGCDHVYIGETGRNAFCRGREHLKGMEKMCGDSVLVEHLRDYHDSDMSDPPCHKFRMNVTNCHSTALDRLVTEAVKIDTSAKTTMNRQHGFRVNSMLKLSSSLGNNTL